MKKIPGFLVPLFLVIFTVNFTLAQENYSTWGFHKNVILNTSGSGALVVNNVLNFPVLVRLGVADSLIFKQALGTGADIRFTKADNATRLQYQIELWDSTNKAADIWVLVDTVKGNLNNQSFRLHWGKTGAVDSSSGSGVFQTSNGFQGVWHMNSGGTGTENDATANAYTATPSATAPTSTTAGAIGSARTFNGTSSYLVALNTASSNLSFPQGGPSTLSAWINSTTNGQKVIVGKSDYQYALQLNSGSNYEGCDYQSGSGWYCVAGGQPPTGQWIHFVDVISPTAESLFVNGALVSGSPVLGASGNARNATYNVFIGALIAGTAPGTATTGTKSRYWNGSIDEVELSNVARSSDWVMLSYQNQQASQTLVSLSDVIPPLAVPPLIVSQPTDQNLVAGGSAKFGVTATGSGTLTFKWVHNNTDTVRTITGTSTDTLSLTNIQASSNNDTYKCVVQNSAGQAVSASANLLVSTSILQGVDMRQFDVRVSASAVLFRLPEGMPNSRISVLDVWGRTLWTHRLPSGATELTWNAIAVNGQTLADGIYLVRISLPDLKDAPILERKIQFTR